ncbi:alpha/beta hydrolase family protein [Caldalkalibacillus mannanilyticus]|uniref:alpha/beta hydrolase family protein n=1 Tax=Caldalkalibacillus mannanilyticus TaxID=1418 RepID=UPI00046A01B4|nr:hypothetical protein [Caldalkalibacillus mannanilyticus]
MTLLEIILFALTTVLIYNYVFGSIVSRTKIIRLIPIAGIVLILHFIMEGYRIQMIPAYLLFAITAISYIYSHYRYSQLSSGENSKMWKRMTVGILGTLSIAAVFFVTFYLFPIVKLKEPTGPYAVGTVDYHWVDPERKETFTSDPNDLRQIMVRAWYPAELTEDAVKAPYAYETDVIKQIRKNETSLKDRILVQSLEKAKNYSYTNIPISNEEEQYPVLIMSPGYGLSHFMYSSMIENLASHGYIVFSIDHTYYTDLPTVFPDGMMSEGQVEIDLDMDIDEEIKVWIGDALLAIENIHKLAENDPHHIMTGKLDTSRIGMLGHSLGGAVVAQIMHHHAKLDAGVNMDGFLFGTPIENGLNNPFLFMRGSEEADAGVPPEELPQDMIELIEEDKKRTQGVLKNGGQLVVLEEADHDSYSDIMLYSPLLTERNPHLLDEINEILLEFFNKNVKATNPTTTLLDTRKK